MSKQLFGILTSLNCLEAISPLGKCHHNDKSKQTSESIFEKCIQNYSHGTQEQSFGAGFALKAWSKNEPLKNLKDS
jgi:hypothetical protein